MTTRNSPIETLHAATHRIPGVPDHAERPSGHQGAPHRSVGAPRQAEGASGHHGRTAHHTPRRPRVMVAWQRRVAALFGVRV